MEAFFSSFIHLVANSIRGELTEYIWEDRSLLVEPSPENINLLLNNPEGSEFIFDYTEHISCEFDNIRFDNYLCTNIIDHACIENYEDLRKSLSEKTEPVLVSIIPGSTNKWYRILRVPKTVML